MSSIAKTQRKQGFTLVEMSIVIIIVGLLISGVAAGTSLIEQARLNSVIVDFRNHQTAYYSFISRYNAVPGDMKNAAAFWPTTCVIGNNSFFCDGNGDGLILSGGFPEESKLAWKHLSLAGFVSQSFPLLDQFNFDSTFAESFANSKVDGAYYAFQSAGTVGFSLMAPTWSGNGDQNVLLIAKGAPGIVIGGAVPSLGALTPDEAFSLDNKLDDATTSSTGALIGAKTGQVRSQDDGTSPTSPCVTAADANAYNVSGTLRTCIFSQLLVN